MRSAWFLVKINPSQIAFLKFILEGYDHLSSLTILDPKSGLTKIYFHPKNLVFINELLEHLKEKLELEILETSVSVN
ncbi:MULTISPECIES: DUF4911 domain-containing protein [Thermodesulfobacterium]|jgi:hypothetical protein|uniref:DUF4911 domain-containing protein n=1 Tax=Thermodesulfobacterium commune TaxID=1741 RepID=A0A117LCP5_9BACT|nr:DUF4911 domain-containing protein [Thermodesulfobacterium sp.]KUJ97714.1 MAG: Uncharacterized protein XD42_0644 [Thermodesulfobacterium sp. 37_54]KUK19491.1 MAG: Uncharacterized protein XD55_0458 [Thermodesulfobacterium commune]KUK38605.1 MAG: Uncharacterized protein XD67_0106 [Thermodesulfobacterium commune]MBZ4681144.1 hypothetical protein [Thermodesulfobacterium sp.]MDK2860895.1 hypothetical protein [Thermodesulfobacterium sp.]